jgi:hypothetical protein
MPSCTATKIEAAHFCGGVVESSVRAAALRQRKYPAALTRVRDKAEVQPELQACAGRLSYGGRRTNGAARKEPFIWQPAAVAYMSKQASQPFSAKLHASLQARASNWQLPSKHLTLPHSSRHLQAQCKHAPNPSFERTPTGMPLQAFISFWALRVLPARAAQLKR